MKLREIYRGKAKVVWATDDPERVVMEFTDAATAFDGAKRGVIGGKGRFNATMSTILFRYLEQEGIATHFIDQVSDNELLCRRLEIVPLEVVVRNRAAGGISRRLGIEEGTPLARPVLEFSYKSDALGDPMVNEDHALALGLATPRELEELREMALATNALLRRFLGARGLELVDFKLEFGRDTAGRLVLGDEISPDTCRLWDVGTGEKLDKDRFRRDLGRVEEAYEEVLRRVQGEPRPPAGAPAEQVFRGVMRVTLKEGVLDPQGRTIAGALHSLGYPGVEEVRVGKLIEIRLRGADHAHVRQQLAEMGKRLLANPVLEDFRFAVEPAEQGGEPGHGGWAGDPHGGSPTRAGGGGLER
ncbi:MAG: phosphoribosylaminoimidazolesuccinocarboxamide synthase [Bacillota bacterium]